MKTLAFFLTISPLLFTGCVQTRQPATNQLAQQQAIEARQRQLHEAEQRQKIQMQLEDNDARMVEAQQQIQQMRAELSGRPSRADLQNLEQRIAALEQMIQRMEVQRAKDREEIIEALTLQMQKVMAQQQQARASASARTHTVAAGETLGAIAAAWGVPSQSIIRANNLSNANVLRIGQKLIIPGN